MSLALARTPGAASEGLSPRAFPGGLRSIPQSVCGPEEAQSQCREEEEDSWERLLSR